MLVICMLLSPNTLQMLLLRLRKHKASIPRKVEDSWEPIINMQVNEFDLKASCDLGSSVSIMPRKIYEMLDLPPLEDCYLDVLLNDNAKKKLMGSINDVLI